MADDNFRSGGDSMAALIANSGETDPKMWEAFGNIPKAYYKGKEQTCKQTPALEMPCFMEQGPDFIDGWKPPGEACGDYDLDFMTGEIYADVAVQYARKIKDHRVLGLIISTIQSKALRGQLVIGGFECGFFDRLGRLAYVGALN